MNHTGRKELIVLILCLLVGFSLRFYSFDRKSLWIDEIHTFNDSRDGLRGQFNYYKENPSYLQPPLFFILTHLFYPFKNPERDLRVIPLIFGVLSLPMIYLLSGQFSRRIALPCTISIAFMAYHISLSQDGRAYSLLMFMGMLSLYFLIQYLKTLKKIHLILTSVGFAILFYTSYSSVLFIAISQILWFYPVEDRKKPPVSSWLVLNIIFLCLCLPWVLFIALNYHGQTFLDPYEHKFYISFWNILHGILNDWAPFTPLTVASTFIFAAFFFFVEARRKAVVLQGIFILPVLVLFLFSKLSNISHFITSRYFIGFLPLFLITLFLSLNAMEDRFTKMRQYWRPKIIFIILLIASNLSLMGWPNLAEKEPFHWMIPRYYLAEKEDFRGLVNFLKGHLKEGDKLFDSNYAFTPGILHYFGVYPDKRHYEIPYYKAGEKEIEFRKSFVYRNRPYTIYYSRTCCTRYLADGGRLWIIGGDKTKTQVTGNIPCVLMGYFDGSYLNFYRFPTDASIYLFLLDPKSPFEKGIDISVE